MLKAGETLASLVARFPRSGRVEWIGLRTCARGPVVSVPGARLAAGRGLEGDHRAARAGSRRQVTLLQHEHLAAVAALAGLDRVAPAALRRNVVVSGINLLALKDRRFRVGGALLAWTGPCHPCSRMEDALGPGGYNAVRGHGGITAEVLEGGLVRVGDPVEALLTRS